jgi:AcrR family transcriptional regulator
MVYTDPMPKLWNETIETHRREVRDAILDTTAALVNERGLLSVSMSEIAEKTGIGRATLYKYFPDVQAILLAWQERGITSHLRYLAEVRDNAGDANGRLEAVLEAYALIQHEHHGSQRQHAYLADHALASLLHGSPHFAHAEHQLRDLVRDLIAEAAEVGAVRSDVPADELAGYCVYALAAASGLRSEAAVRRLVGVTLAGLRPGT